MDDDLGETTGQDTESSQDGTVCVDPHEVEPPLQVGAQGAQKVRMCQGRNAEAATLRTYYHNDGKTEDLDDVCNSV